MQIDIENRAGKKILAQLSAYKKELLEIGCGAGRITSLLSRRIEHLTSVDVNPEAVLETKNACTSADCLVGSGQSLPFTDQSFDFVLFTQSLHHQNAVTALKEADRVLREDGGVLVLEPVFGTELEDICLFFQDEKEARLHALYGIMTSGFVVEYSEIFSTIWRFNNINELYRWLFDYYSKPWDASLIDMVDQVLQSKLGFEPLDIEEKLMMISLKKTNHLQTISNRG